MMQRIFKTLRTPGSTIYAYEFPFKGYVLTTGKVTEEGGIISYNGKTSTVREWYDNLTFHENSDKDIRFTDGRGCDELFSNHQKSLVSKFVEIDEDRYYEMLEVLPPMMWHKYKGMDIFFISEAYYGSIHSCFVRFDGKRYESSQSIHEKDEVIYKQLLKDIKDGI